MRITLPSLTTHLTRCGLLLAGLLPAGAALAQPTITAVSPAANAKAAPVAGPVSTTFSQPLTAASAAALQVYPAQRGGRRGAASGTTTVSGNTLTYTPSAASPFGAGETVDVTTTRAAASSSGSLARAQVRQFTTAVGGSGRGVFIYGNNNYGIRTNYSPSSSAVGDLNGDGNLDVVNTPNNASTNEVYVWLGNGTATYTAGPTVTMGGNPRAANLADVDGDGDLDLLTITTAYYTGNTTSVSVRLNNGSAVFGGAQELATGAASGFVLGDVDGDGDRDLLVATGTTTGVVTVWTNNGSGTFASGSPVSVNSTPRTLVLSDLDNDGDLDLLSGSAALNGPVSVRLNSGSGTFSGTQAVASTGYSYGLAAGDVDGDGDADLVFSNRSSNTVQVRLNNGSGSFSGTQAVAVSSEPFGVALGDVDADGDLDLFSVASGYGVVDIRRNNGTGTFSGTERQSVGSNPTQMTLADMDNDQDLDMVVTNHFVNFIAVAYNREPYPQPVIAAASPLVATAGTSVTLTGTNLDFVMSVTVNGASVNRATITNNSPTSLTFLVPAGASATGDIRLVTAGGTATVPNFTVKLLATTMPAANAKAAPVANSAVTATFTEDVAGGYLTGIAVYSAQVGGRKPGLLTATANVVRYTSTLAVPRLAFRPGELVQVTIPSTVRSRYSLAAQPRVWQFTTAVRGTGRGTFTAGTDPAVGSSPRSVVAGDVDGDGDLDLVVANVGGNTASVSLNGGNASGSNPGAFGGTQLVTVGNGPTHAVLADVDGDGDLDVLTANFSDNTVSVSFNNGTGTFSSTQTLASASGVRHLAVGDVDADGDLDLVTANQTDNTVGVRFNNGRGTFGAEQRLAVGTDPVQVALGDVDNDGDLDLLAVNAGSSTVSVRLNGGDASGSNTGAFGGTGQMAVTGTPQSLAVGDFDGDGDLDVATASKAGNQVSISLNDGVGNFGNPVNVPTVGEPTGLAVGDLDADGDLDLVVANSLANTAGLLLNNGTAAFTPGAPVAVQGSPQGVALADVDGDGDLDVLTANVAASTVSVRLNGGNALATAATHGGVAALNLHPNPARTSTRLVGLLPRQAVQLLDALGRPVAHTTADAAGTATLALPVGLPTGVYMVRAGTRTVRLMVE
ncbi:VCBS repeat-containing protein [Hymenobacter sp. BT683]|uniref:VCBS repeat-containing protein n=1 Tax=Hymenobacter jeongseonensis TaxID=2791027 RepID=A0ABS0IP33_9BACT|nr:FG-GAP-like repeat-containing protein [Hymenobacter jeongseonensis]MBF9239809.1 VCBS repeat-containing protein [Hymenobacter jeongseonensis]